MKKNDRKSYTDILAGLLIFGVFAVGMIVVLLAGAGVYRRLTARDTAAYDARTCAGYFAAKVRSAPEADKIEVEYAEELGANALRIPETVSGEEYATYVYLYDGWISELYIPGGSEPDYTAGERLLEAQSLDFALSEEGLLRVRVVTAQGVERTVLLNLSAESGETAYEE